MNLNLRQVLNDLRDEKEAIDETIAALERLLMRQHKSSRKKLTESLAPVHSKKRADTADGRKMK